MKLSFTCPQKGESFATDQYSLQKGYQVLEDNRGERVLRGAVILDSGCPFCGVRHVYEADSIGCPFNEERDEK